eukprot:1187229-Prorocentrum_minimum.AAC.1
MKVLSALLLRLHIASAQDHLTIWTESLCARFAETESELEVQVRSCNLGVNTIRQLADEYALETVRSIRGIGGKTKGIQKTC